MAPNFHSSAKALGFDVDYGKLLDLFRAGGGLIRAYYYTAISEDQEFSSIRPLIDWLDCNGYAVVTKPATECADASGRRKVGAARASISRSTPWRWRTISNTSSYFPATAIFAR